MPPSGANAMNVIFADDVTQIIQNFRDNKQQLAEDTVSEIKRINTYENKWKIKTNTNKFKAISISKTKPAPIYIDNNEIEYSNNGSILGYQVSMKGNLVHIKERISKAKMNLTKLRIFSGLDQDTKLYLYKMLIQPILIYPPVPMHTMSREQTKNIQRVQNKAIRWIKNNQIDLGTTMESLHNELNLEPINIRLYRLAEKTWNRIQENGDHMYDILNELKEKYQNKPEHRWWPSSVRLLQEEPPPVYA